MHVTTILYGAFLILLGVGGYVLTGAESVTAMIPAFFGVPVALLGWMASNPARRKLAMHIAVVLGLLGLLGTARGLSGLPAVFAGEAERPAAVISQSAMFVASLLFVILCVRSFIQARKAQAA